MRSTNYPRVSRAVFCSALLLSQHAVVDANNWATGRSRRSSTLAVMQPGGRNRPIRDWKAIKRESEEKLEKVADEKAQELARQAGELVEGVEDNAEEVGGGVSERIGQLETPAADVLNLEEDTSDSIGVMVAKAATVVAIARVGVYSARKMVAFAKAFIKARKESSEESAGEGGEVSAVAMDDDSGDEGQEGDDEAEQATTEADGDGDVDVDGGNGEKEDADAEEEEKDGEVTDGFVTADEEEESAAKAASDMLGSVADAAKDMKKKAKSSLKDLKSGLGEAVNRGDGDVDAEEAGEGVDLSARLPKGGDGGKVDVSYV